MQVPPHKPLINEEEIQAVVAALRSGELGGNGPVGQSVEKWMEERFGVRHVLLTTSCTHAMEVALMVLGIGPGDEVILPSFTFPSAANAICLQGATPVFAEVEPETLNLDVKDVAKCTTSRTKAIMAVHYAGVSCRMEELRVLAQENSLYLVEDAAQGVGARYKGNYLGTLGDIGCYSFHETKNITCGEGGALVTNNLEWSQAAEIVREKGTNRSAFLRGEVERYTWIRSGSSYVLSDLLAALLQTQLQRLDEIIAARESIYNFYQNELRELEERELIRLPRIPEGAESNYHIFHFHLPDQAKRDLLLEGLKKEGISASFHYVPLHSSPYGQQLVDGGRSLPLTEQLSRTLIRLPIFPQLTEAQCRYIVKTVRKLVLETECPNVSILKRT